MSFSERLLAQLYQKYARDPEQNRLGEDYAPIEKDPQEQLFDPGDEEVMNRDDRMTFDHTVGLIVPSEKYTGDPVDPRIREEVLNVVEHTMASSFGGFTSTGTEGGFEMNGRVAKEEGTYIWSFVEEDDLEGATNLIRELGLEVKRILQQNSVAVVIDNQAEIA